MSSTGFRRGRSRSLHHGDRRDGILGIDYLRRFNITIDHEAEIVTLNKWGADAR